MFRVGNPQTLERLVAGNQETSEKPAKAKVSRKRQTQRLKQYLLPNSSNKLIGIDHAVFDAVGPHHA